MPLEAGFVQDSTKIAPARNCSHPVMIHQQSHGHSASAGTDKSLVERISGLIPRGLEVQDIDVVLRPIDLTGHRPKSLVCVIEKLHDFPTADGKGSLLPIELHQRSCSLRQSATALVNFCRLLGVSATVSFVGSRAQNALHQLVCLLIRAQGLSHCPPRSEDQIERNANNWP